MQMIPVRVFFEKTGRAKYTSHLDTMRTLSRALKRSGLPVWYTQGFNPHLYSTFSLPIALGYESICESVDIRLTEPVEHGAVLERLNASLPPGLRAVRAGEPLMDAATIAWADYEIRLDYPPESIQKQTDKLERFFREPSIEVAKKTKKGEKTVDLKPLSALLGLAEEAGTLVLKLRLASGNTVNINPTLFLKAFSDWSGAEPERSRIVRTAIYNKDLQLFS